MNANVVNVAVVDGKIITQTVEISSVKNGQPVRIKAVQGGKYILAEGANGIAPENITIKRVGKDLHIALEGSDPDQPQLIIEDFEGTGGQLVGVAEDGSYHEYISSDAEQDRSAAFLIEGVEAPQVLGAQPLVGFGDGLAAAAGIGWFWPALLGLAALGVLGGVYAATRDDDNGSGDGSGGSGNTDKGSIGGVDDNVGDKQGLIENGGSTDDTTPTFTGEGRPGTSVEIIDNGKTIGTAIVGEDGKWEYIPPAPGLEDGKHEIIIVPVDKDGNKGTPSPGYEIIVDTVAPSRPLIDGLFDDVAPQEGQIGIGGHTNDTTPTLSGSGEAGSIIHIYDNGVEIGTALADAEGKWSFTPDPALTEGPHEFTATSEDAAGNISTPSLPFPIIVDITGPGKPGAGTGGIDDILDNVGSEQGSIGEGDVTDDTTPTLIGSGGQPGDIVTIIDNDREIGTAVVGEDGRWEFTPDPELTEGPHELVVVITDPAGNESEPSDPVTIIVDITGPGKPGVGTGGIDDILDNVGSEQGSIGEGDVTDDTTPTLIGSGGQPGDIVTIIDNDREIGTAVVGEDGRWEFTPDPELTEGPHELVVVITDPTGKESEPSDPITIIVDITAPGKPGVGTGGIDDILDNVGSEQGSIGEGDVTDDTTPTLIGSGGEPGDIVTIIDNDREIGTAVVGEDGRWEFTPDPELTEGPHELVVVITDPAGNESEPSDPVTIIVDITAPGKPGVGTGGIDDILDNVGSEQGSIGEGDVTDDTTPTLIGSGGEPGDIVTIIDNDREIGTAVVGEDGRWEFTPDPELTEGPHELVVVITDPAGNESEPSDPVTIIVDTMAPVAPSLDAVVDDQGAVTGNLVSGQTTDDARPDLSGTAEAGSLVTIYDNGVPIGSVIATDGTWTFTPTVPLINGPHTLTVTATDTAGNVSVPTPGFDLDVMAGGAPTSPAITSVVDDQGDLQGPIGQGESTDDARPTINGTGTSGDVITLFANNQPVGSAVVDANGQWSITPDTALDEGLNNLTAQATNAAGNPSPTTGIYPINIDTMAPEAPVTQSLMDDVGAITGAINAGDTTDDASPTFSGTAEAGAVVVIYDGVNPIGSVMADATGAWSFTPATALIDGPHSFSAQAVDSAGNVGPMGPAIPFIVDTSAVVISITSVMDNAGSVTGNLATGQVTDDTTPTLNGQATPGGVVSIYDGDNLLGSVVADASGQWTFTTPVLTEGGHNLTATVTTEAGGESAPTPIFETIIDTTAPGVPVIDSVADDVGDTQGSITDGGSTDDSTPTLSGSGLQPGDIVKVFDGSEELGSTTVLADGTWIYTPTTPLNDGPHEFTVVAIDPAGNESAPSAPHNIIIDTMAPVAPSLDAVVDDQGAVTGNLVSGQTTDDARPDLSGTAEAGSLVTIYDNGVPIGSVIATNGTWTFTPTVPLINGPHTLTVTATDAAGNVSAPTPGFDLDVVAGGTPPAPAITSVVDDQGDLQGPIGQGEFTDDTRPTINGTGTSGDVITLFANNQPVGSAVVDANGQWSITPDTALDEGLNNLTAQATNAAGNPSPTTGVYPINVDTMAPEAPVTQSLMDDVGAITGAINAGDTTDDASPTFSGTAEAGAVVVIYDGVNPIGSVLADATGAWSFTPATALIDGPHSFSAQAVDSAGNVGPMGPAIPFIVDTSAVVISITSVMDNAGSVIGNLATGQVTDDTTPTLNGQATPGGIVSIYDGSNLLGSVVADASGQWSFTTPVLTEGGHNLTATVTTAAGGESAPTPVFQTIIDTTAPGVPVIGSVTDDVGDTQGAIADGGSTDDSTPTLSGSGLQPGDVVRVFDGSEELGSTTVLADGTWIYTPTTPLNDGPHEFTVVAIDPAGNESAPSAPWTIDIDTSAPIAAAVVESMGKDSGTDSGDFLTNDGSAGRLIQGSLTAALGAGEKVQVSTDGGATWLDVLMNPNGTWSVLDQDNHTRDWMIQTRVVDSAGNSNVNNLSVTMDTDRPNEPLSVTRSGDVITVFFDGATLEAGDIVNVVVGNTRIDVLLTDNDITNGSVDVTTTASASELYAAAIIDKAGNASNFVHDSTVTHRVDFTGVPTQNIETSLDLGVITVTSLRGWVSIAYTNANTDPSGATSDGQALQLAAGSSGARLDLKGSTATSVAFNLYGTSSTGNVVIFQNAAGDQVHTVHLSADGGGGANSGGGLFEIDMPPGVTFSSMSFFSAVGDGWSIDNLEFGVNSSATFDPANQTIEGTSGTYYGDEGDSTFSVADTTNLDAPDIGVMGGLGMDTLQVTTSGQILDLTSLGSKIQSVEIIDITGTGNNTLNLSLGDVLEQGETSLFTADDTTQMMIKGNAGDIVNLDDLLPDGTDPGDWATAGTATVAGVTYNVFQHSTLDAQMLVQDGVTTNLV